MKQVARFSAALLFATVGTMMSATAQSSPPDYSELANAITHRFFTDEAANAGNDWCYEVEGSPNETVWNFAAINPETNKRAYYPHIIDYAVRIRLVFRAVNPAVDPKDYSPLNDAAGNRVMDTASLFMGFDLMKNSA